MTLPGLARTRDSDAALRRIRIGTVVVTPIVQFHYRVDPVRFFPELAAGTRDEDAWYWQPPYCEDDRLVIDMGGFLVRTPQRTILIDAGVGNGKPRPNPLFDNRDDDWFGALSRLGVGPDEIDTVVFTHLHVDHVGFATRFDGTSWVPTFPDAAHLTTEAELAFWTSDAARPQLERLGDYINDSVLPLREANVLHVVQPDLRICDEVRLVPAAGHTPGNVAVEVSSDGQRALFAGDMVHHALQLAFPDWSTDYCVDRYGASDARRELLRGLADRDALLFPAHFPNSLPGRIVTDPTGGYRYQPTDGEQI